MQLREMDPENGWIFDLSKSSPGPSVLAAISIVWNREREKCGSWWIHFRAICDYNIEGRKGGRHWCSHLMHSPLQNVLFLSSWGISILFHLEQEEKCGSLLLSSHIWLYRGGNKGLFVLLSRTQAGPGRTVMLEQEEISPNHVQTFIFLSVYFTELGAQ